MNSTLEIFCYRGFEIEIQNNFYTIKDENKKVRFKVQGDKFGDMLDILKEVIDEVICDKLKAQK